MSEQQYKPQLVTAPGEMLKERLDEIGMSQAELAARIGHSKKMVNDVIQGRAPIVPETALELERVLSVPARFWNNAEQLYRDALARQRERERLAGDQSAWHKRVPVKKMVQMGWIAKHDDEVDRWRAVLSFFGVATLEALESCGRDKCLAFRQAAAQKAEPYAVLAWLRQGELQAQRIRTAPYDRDRFDEALGAIRGWTRKPASEFMPEMVAACAAAGVALTWVPELPGIGTHGATQWVSTNKALIQMSLRHKTDDQFWFTFFHEAAHVLLHPKKSVFLERDDVRDSLEDEANQFAQQSLIGPRQWQLLFQMKPRRALDIELLAAQFDLAPGILVGRLQREGLLPWSHLNHLKRKLAWGDTAVRAAGS